MYARPYKVSLIVSAFNLSILGVPYKLSIKAEIIITIKPDNPILSPNKNEISGVKNTAGKL